MDPSFPKTVPKASAPAGFFEAPRIADKTIGTAAAISFCATPELTPSIPATLAAMAGVANFINVLIKFMVSPDFTSWDGYSAKTRARH